MLCAYLLYYTVSENNSNNTCTCLVQMQLFVKQFWPLVGSTSRTWKPWDMKTDSPWVTCVHCGRKGANRMTYKPKETAVPHYFCSQTGTLAGLACGLSATALQHQAFFLDRVLKLWVIEAEPGMELLWETRDGKTQLGTMTQWSLTMYFFKAPRWEVLTSCYGFFQKRFKLDPTLMLGCAER